VELFTKVKILKNVAQSRRKRRRREGADALRVTDQITNRQSPNNLSSSEKHQTPHRQQSE
jgi:hypothetical protein